MAGGLMQTGRAPLQPDAEDTARYIGGLARELRALASKADLGFLAYLLAMVEDDAEATAKRLSERREDT
jgi:hypothetical protein